ncbi:hypothetical protein VpaJT1_60 [Vibrio phage VpaJT_1]|nr:hypothetical protein VpaJT1_60 [Vibrio phage VpaJT_1]
MSRVKFIDTSKPHYALKKFTMDKQEYLSGEEIPSAIMDALNERILQRLVKYRFIGQNAPISTKAVGFGGMNPPEKKPVSVEPVIEPKPDTATEEPTPETDGKTVKLNHVGGGYYEAIGSDGSNVLPEKVQGKDNAKMIAENLGFTVT